MPELRGSWVPENEAETELIGRLSTVSREAYEDGVPQPEIASALAYMASVVLLADPESDPEPVEPAEPPDKLEECPDCEQEIEGVQPFIGGNVIISPCGCEADVSDVPGWVDDPNEEDDQ